jgi:VCBS repeat-containing protein
MFDAAAAATAAEVRTEQVAQEQAEAAVSSEAPTTDGDTHQADNSHDMLQALSGYMPAESRTEVVFVDPTVPNYRELLSGMDPNVEVIMLDGGSDGIEQMAGALSGRTGIDAIHLISHGTSGELQLGTGTLNVESMSGRYADELTTIQQALSEQADILLYGCDFAKGDAGQAATDRIAELTGADVKASVDLTGHDTLGGDWDLEYQVGLVETSLVVGQVAEQNWADILAVRAIALDTAAVANEAPTDLSLSSNTVAENAADGTVVGTVSGTDPDAGDTKTYSLTDTAGGRFAINSTTGVLTVADGSLLNYESATSHTVTVRVTDSGGLTYDESFTINVVNVNEAPTITSDGGGAAASMTVAENTTAVTTVAASDVDAGTTLTYSITGGADASRFRIDSATGSLRFAAAPNFERPTDADRNNVYQVTVRVSDGQGGTDTQAISVRVTDVNEAPTITSNRGGDVAAVTIRENSTAVTTVRATDPDRGTTITYSVVGGTDAALFSINSRTGALRFVSAPNFERPTDTDGNNVYQVVVQASDGRGGTDSQTINVTVTDRNDVPHELDFIGGFVAEGASNGTVVGQALVSDEDRIDTHTFSLVDDAGGRFAIHPRTGIITVTNSALIDFDMASSHTISVRVIDAGRLARTESFTISVVNTNETPIDISLTGDTIQENTASGTVVGTVTTQDPDANDSHVYSLVDNAGGRFTIDLNTGQVTVLDGSLLDHEGATSHSITVRSTDSGGLMIDRTFTISVSNINEAPTALSLSSQSVAENSAIGTVVGTVATTDQDLADTHTYALVDDAGGRFAINRATGEITVADGTRLDHETAGSHTLIIRSTDAGGLSRDHTFTITVTDAHEPASVPFRPAGSLAIPQGGSSDAGDVPRQEHEYAYAARHIDQPRGIGSPRSTGEDTGTGALNDPTVTTPSQQLSAPFFQEAPTPERSSNRSTAGTSRSPGGEDLQVERNTTLPLTHEAGNDANAEHVDSVDSPETAKAVASAWLLANVVNVAPPRKSLKPFPRGDDKAPADSGSSTGDRPEDERDKGHLP